MIFLIFLLQVQKKRLKRQWKKLKDKQVLMKAQATALDKPLDTERLKQVTENLQTVKKIRETENAGYAAKAEELWLGEFNTVRNSCKRELFGYVAAGSMSYTVGGFVGYGFVAAKGLLKWLTLTGDKTGRRCVLTRETSSTQYRFATLTVL